MNIPIVDVIIPAFNEELSIHSVITDIPKQWVRNIIVCNNLSTDKTAEIAQRAGAIIVQANKKGYGFACLQGMEYISNLEPKPDIVIFLDGDYSDYPEYIPDFVKLIRDEDVDLAIGSRVLGKKEKKSMTIAQIFGNWLATKLIKLFFGHSFTDLGPFRAIKYSKLLQLEMKDQNYGWTVEMQVKAAKAMMKCKELPVDYRQRIGISKVSGTIKGTFMAGYKILWTIFKSLL